MITEEATAQELIKELENTVTNYTAEIRSLNDEKVNQVPYEESWTIGELFSHITKSIDGMAQTMSAEGKPAERKPNERVSELRNIFLDFSTKMKSPDFILPDDGPFKKHKIETDLLGAFEKLRTNSIDKDVNVLLEGLPFGSVTKYELLHFVLCHSERHLNQLKKITKALSQN